MPQKLVENVNSLSPSDFFEKYLSQNDLSTLILPDTSPGNFQTIVTGTRGPTITTETKAILDQCLELIESTSADDYRNSELKWSHAKKKKEMYLPDMRYMILLHSDPTHNDDDDPNTQRPRPPRPSPIVAGFVSFMVTYEDGHEVIYCYELHLSPPYRGNGLGKKLMAIVEGVGRRVGVEKAMLTVFRANERAIGMYMGIGYGVDEFSPGPRRLRNGSVKEAGYVILSKALR